MRGIYTPVMFASEFKVGVTMYTTVFLTTGAAATSVVAHTVAWALGPSFTSYISSDRPTTTTELQIRAHLDQYDPFEIPSLPIFTF